MLLPIDCFQVEEQISAAAQTLEATIRNPARPAGRVIPDTYL